MDASFFDQLLYRGESETLDFKVDQYAFDGATDDERGEFVKDILAFANAWREEAAYVLIGVQEVVGGKSNVTGITKAHLSDNALQQLINSKTQRPIRFSYQAIEVGGKQCAVLHIPIQERPFFLKQPYGKLKANEVYVRRGSSTAIALPDEIANMGKRISNITDSQFTIEVELGASDLEREKPAVCVNAWLHNIGRGTAYEMRAEVIWTGDYVPETEYLRWELTNLDHKSQRWTAAETLHPNEKRFFFQILLKDGVFARDARTLQHIPQILDYKGLGVQMSVRLFVKDQFPNLFHVILDKDDIMRMAPKVFSPATDSVS